MREHPALFCLNAKKERPAAFAAGRFVFGRGQFRRRFSAQTSTPAQSHTPEDKKLSSSRDRAMAALPVPSMDTATTTGPSIQPTVHAPHSTAGTQQRCRSAQHRHLQNALFQLLGKARGTLFHTRPSFCLVFSIAKCCIAQSKAPVNRARQTLRFVKNCRAAAVQNRAPRKRNCTPEENAGFVFLFLHLPENPKKQP